MGVSTPQRELLLELLRRGSPCQFHERGESMLPTLRPGDRIEAVPCQGEPEIGEIVVFEHEGWLCSHRVLRKIEGALITRGDNGRREDDPLPVERVLGRVVRASRNGVEIPLKLGLGAKIMRSMARYTSLPTRIFLHLHARQTI